MLNAKVALCLSGQPRFIRENYPNIKEHILDIVDTDVFIHTWTSIDRVDGSIQKFSKEEIKDKISVYKPLAYEIDNQQTFTPTQTELSWILDYPEDKKLWMYQRVMSMFYSIYRANLCRINLTCIPPLYDAVIRCRFDNILLSPFDIRTLWQDPSWLRIHRYSFGGPFNYPVTCCGDQLAYGSPRIMNRFSDCYIYIQMLLQEIRRIHAGSILTHYVDNYLDIGTLSSPFVTDAQDRIMQP
jgi:hypothetical protein